MAQEMIVSDLSSDQIKRLIERYEFQIRDCMRTVRKSTTYVEARIALKAANVARKKKEFLLKHAS